MNVILCEVDFFQCIHNTLLSYGFLPFLGDSYEWQLLAQLPNPKSSFYSICVTNTGIMLTGEAKRYNFVKCEL